MTAPVSPRTPEEPMAFTNQELLRGAASAWVIFMAMLLLFSTIVAAGLMAMPGWAPDPVTWVMLVLLIDLCVLLVGGGVSAIVMAFGAALVRPLGRSLRRVRSLRLHALVYTAIGLVIAAAYVALLLATPLIQFIGGFLILPAIAAPLSVPLGWWRTVHLAFLEDRGLRVTRTRGKADTDATVEDAARET